MTQLYVKMFKSNKRVFSEIQAKQLGSMILPDAMADKNRFLISEIEILASTIHRLGKTHQNLKFEDIQTHKDFVSSYERLNFLAEKFLKGT
jgi:hypothetical protein